MGVVEGGCQALVVDDLDRRRNQRPSIGPGRTWVAPSGETAADPGPGPFPWTAERLSRESLMWARLRRGSRGSFLSPRIEDPECLLGPGKTGFRPLSALVIPRAEP
jgi:hypothetical protein